MIYMLNPTKHGISTAYKSRVLNSCFQTLSCIYHANRSWHFNMYEHDKFYAELS